MNTTTHDVKSVTVSEHTHSHFKTIRITVVEEVLVYDEVKRRYIRREVEHEHRFFTDNLDLKVEYEAAEEE